MKCPCCSEKTISFADWCRKRSAFFWSCPHCEASLKANRVTWTWFGAGFVLMLLAVAAIILLESTGQLDKTWSRPLLAVAIIVTGLPAAWLGYRHGGYVVRQK